MVNGRGSNGNRLTPDKFYNWTLAVYPLAILIGVGFILISHEEITTELVGLLIGLLTAGSLKAAIKSTLTKEEDSNDTNRRNTIDYIHRPGGNELEPDDRSGPDDSNRRCDLPVWLRWYNLFPTFVRPSYV